MPADVLKEVFQAETVLACDIGADVKMTGRQDYGDTLTGLQILLNMLPWSKTLQVRWPAWKGGGGSWRKGFYRRLLYLIYLSIHRLSQAPSMGEISSQLMYVRSVEQLERAKELIDCYLR